MGWPPQRPQWIALWCLVFLAVDPQPLFCVAHMADAVTGRNVEGTVTEGDELANVLAKQRALEEQQKALNTRQKELNKQVARLAKRRKHDQNITGLVSVSTSKANKSDTSNPHTEDWHEHDANMTFKNGSWTYADENFPDTGVWFCNGVMCAFAHKYITVMYGSDVFKARSGTFSPEGTWKGLTVMRTWQGLQGIIYSTIALFIICVIKAFAFWFRKTFATYKGLAASFSESMVFFILCYGSSKKMMKMILLLGGRPLRLKVEQALFYENLTIFILFVLYVGMKYSRLRSAATTLSTENEELMTREGGEHRRMRTHTMTSLTNVAEGQFILLQFPADGTYTLSEKLLKTKHGHGAGVAKGDVLMQVVLDKPKPPVSMLKKIWYAVEDFSVLISKVLFFPYHGTAAVPVYAPSHKGDFPTAVDAEGKLVNTTWDMSEPGWLWYKYSDHHHRTTCTFGDVVALITEDKVEAKETKDHLVDAAEATEKAAMLATLARVSAIEGKLKGTVVSGPNYYVISWLVPVLMALLIQQIGALVIAAIGITSCDIDSSGSECFEEITQRTMFYDCAQKSTTTASVDTTLTGANTDNHLLADFVKEDNDITRAARVSLSSDPAALPLKTISSSARHLLLQMGGVKQQRSGVTEEDGHADDDGLDELLMADDDALLEGDNDEVGVM